MLLLLGCAPPAPPAPPEPTEIHPPTPAVVAPPETFTLVGRAAPEGLLVPSLPDGRSLLGPQCATVNTTLGGHGPPCLAERWRSAEREVLFLLADPAATLQWGAAAPVPARTRWPCLGVELNTCLEDPLMVPPARDPGAERRLTPEGWLLSFSGANRCGLGGTLLLATDRDHGTWSTLRVDGLPWGEGGRQRAHTHFVDGLRPR